ncbi:metalloregulator ArsR/SmtB family transcription factor [Amycolatopsis sp. NPDC050768]|uniref:ArsR/SmtB family transcription factor n=1 Tax=Amycolatopsis sp. NPDC050768 TaxID=3154839 RepID=UPI00340B1AAA
MPDSTPPPTASGAPLAKAPLSAEHAVDLATGFKALGDPVRLRLLSLICASNGDTSVSDLAAAFTLSGLTISHHLKVLREAGLIEASRRGTSIHYRPRGAALDGLAGRLAAPGS